MTATKISDLLPISDGIREPHAYQVFGLEDGEQDTGRITKAVQATVSRLKAAKSQTNPKLWGAAARLVQDARITLTDPDKKAQLDARFGIVAIDPDPGKAVDLPPAGSPQPGSSSSNTSDPLSSMLPSADPLASVLPQADPLADVLPPSNPLAPSNPPAPAPTTPTSALPNVPAAGPTNPVVPGDPGLLAAATQPTPVEVPGTAAPDAVAPVAPVVVKAEKRGRKRRRSSFLGTLIFLVLTVGMIGLIGIIGYFLMYGSGQVAITNTDGQITISTKPTDGSAPPEVSQPRPIENGSREFDPVMGSLAGNVPPPVRPSLSDGSDDFGGFGQPGGNFREPESPDDPDMMRMEDSADPAKPMLESEAPIESPTEPETPMDPAPAEPEPEPAALSDEMIAAADQAMEKVGDLIRDANWKEMKESAEKVVQMPMTEEQKEAATGLYEIADLATYYRSGIERAVADLSAGNEIAVTAEFLVIVVEKGDDLLVLRRNEKIYRFTFDQFSMPLANELATYTLPQSPTVAAARAAYEAIAPRSNEDYRAQAVQTLREITDEVEGADPKRVATAIERLFPGDSG